MWQYDIYARGTSAQIASGRWEILIVSCREHERDPSSARA